MKSNVKLSLIAVVAAAAGVAFPPLVHARDGDVQRSRADVRAETIAAVRAGAIPSGEGAISPDYSTFESQRSRAEVRAEAIAALRAGLIANGEQGIDTHDSEFESEKTRAQVVAETREAMRLGLLRYSGEAGPEVASAEQLRMIAEAGLRAQSSAVAAAATVRIAE